MVSFIGKAQVNLNEYKYIIVPKRFDGFKKQKKDLQPFTMMI